jgi:hypothetical protein
MKFLFEIVHTGRRSKEAPDYAERQLLIKNILTQHGPQILYKILYGGIVSLPMYTLNDITEVVYEIKELMPEVSIFQCKLKPNVSTVLIILCLVIGVLKVGGGGVEEAS